jgi:hypothetical protein
MWFPQRSCMSFAHLSLYWLYACVSYFYVCFLLKLVFIKCLVFSVFRLSFPHLAALSLPFMLLSILFLHWASPFVVILWRFRGDEVMWKCSGYMSKIVQTDTKKNKEMVSCCCLSSLSNNNKSNLSSWQFYRYTLPVYSVFVFRVFVVGK